MGLSEEVSLETGKQGSLRLLDADRLPDVLSYKGLINQIDGFEALQNVFPVL